METRPAAFFRVEGTLLRHGALRASAFFAANAGGFRERALKLGQVVAFAPLALALRQSDRTTANRAAYAVCRGMSEDRVALLSDEYFEEALLPSLMTGGRELIASCRDEGYAIVLVSEALSFLAERVAEELGPVEELHANRLEFKSELSTGRLLNPVVGGFESGRWAREFASQRGIDLARSRAYASNGPDLMLLTAVGEPCAVNPDFTLRRAAKEADWPVVYYDA